MSERRRRHEDGMSIAMAVLALTMVAMIMLYVGTQALNSMYTARKKSDRSVGMAAGDSAIEKYRVALQSGLADETNGYLLDRTALQALVRGQGNIQVLPNSQVAGMRGMRDVLPSVPNWARQTVVERGTDTIGYWQVFHIHQPRYWPTSPPSDIVIYLRAWATGSSGGAITTKPRIFRVSYRPGFFSDYQVVTDAPFVRNNFGSTFVDGPIHSNGYQYLDWLSLDANNTPRLGIYFDGTPGCGPQARFSTSQNTPIVVSGNSCSAAANAARRDAREISLLGAQQVFESIRLRSGRGNAVARDMSRGSGLYRVELTNGAVRVDGRSIPLVQTGPDTSALALLFDGDVILSGSVSAGARAARVTIATRRRGASDRRPQVFLRNTGGRPVVGAADLRNSVGVVTEGDVVLNGRSQYSCLSQVNLAAISTAGSISIPPEFVTIAPPAVDLRNRDCGPITFNGSFSSHGPMTPMLRWIDARSGPTPIVGYSQPTFRYNRNLFLSPPPFFPTATPWAVTKVKDADTRCFDSANAGAPSCE